MTVALFLLRCTELGLSMADLEDLDVGQITDMFTEKANDGYEWKVLANQEDMRKF